MISTVIFDIGNVLVDFRPREFILDKGVSEEKADRILKASVFGGSWGKLDRGVESERSVIEEFVRNEPALENEIRTFFANTKGIVKQRPEAKPMIKGLKDAGFSVLALSNYPRNAYEDDPQSLDFLELMDGYILSYRDKVVKPEEPIYYTLIGRYNLVPSECLYVDDLEENLVTARRLGINTILYKDYDSLIKEFASYNVTFTC